MKNNVFKRSVFRTLCCALAVVLLPGSVEGSGKRVRAYVAEQPAEKSVPKKPGFWRSVLHPFKARQERAAIRRAAQPAAESAGAGGSDESQTMGAGGLGSTVPLPPSTLPRVSSAGTALARPLGRSKIHDSDLQGELDELAAEVEATTQAAQGQASEALQRQQRAAQNLSAHEAAAALVGAGWFTADQHKIVEPWGLAEAHNTQLRQIFDAMRTVLYRQRPPVGEDAVQAQQTRFLHTLDGMASDDRGGVIAAIAGGNAPGDTVHQRVRIFVGLRDGARAQMVNAARNDHGASISAAKLRTALDTKNRQVQQKHLARQRVALTQQRAQAAPRQIAPPSRRQPAAATTVRGAGDTPRRPSPRAELVPAS